MQLKRLFSRFGNVKFFAEGDGGGDGGGGGGNEAPDWHAEFPCLAENAENSKVLAKYKDVNAALESSIDAQKKVGRPYWLPKDHSKLTDVQKEEIRANVAVMDAAPATPDAYNFDIPEGVAIDAQGLADYKVHCHGLHKSNEQAQADLNFQTEFVNRILKEELKANTQRSIDNFNKFATECGGESAAVLKTVQIKNFLQSKCTGDDGKADPKMWEEFYKRISDSDRMVELVLLRALEAPARAHAEGGGGGGGGPSTKVGGDDLYAHMRP